MNIWTPDPSASPISAAQIQAWEQQRGLRMPAVLQQAMLIQNGGVILDSSEPSITIHPLEEWQPADPEDLEISDFTGDPRLMIAFGETEYGTTLLLNYGRLSPNGEPLVGRLHHDGMDLEEGTGDVAAFLAKLSAAVTDRPAIDGTHAAHLSRMGQTQLVGKDYAQHCLIGRDCDGRLIQMTYFSGPDDERWSAIYLPEPLKRASLSIAHDRFYGTHGYRLDVVPQETAGIREWSSRKLASGRWKNDVCEGAPVYSIIHSLELEPLILLRQLLAGPPQTQAQAEADTLRIEYLRRMASSTPKQREAADLYISKVEGEAAMKDMLGSMDDDAGLDDETSKLMRESNNLLKETMGQTGGMMGMLYNTVTTMMGSGASSVPEDIRQLIDRMVAAETAVEKENE